MSHPAFCQPASLLAALALVCGASILQASESTDTAATGAEEPDLAASDADTAATSEDAGGAKGAGEGFEDQILRTVYACPDDVSFEVVTLNTAEGNSYAVIEHDGHLVPMQQAISGSGVRWLPVDPDTELELWEHQGTISLNAGNGGEPILQECPVEAE